MAEATYTLLTALLTTVIAAIGLSTELRRGNRLTGAGIVVLMLLAGSFALATFQAWARPRLEAVERLQVVRDEEEKLLALRGNPINAYQLDHLQLRIQQDMSRVPKKDLAIGVISKLCFLYTGIGMADSAESLRVRGYKLIAAMGDHRTGHLYAANLLSDEAESRLFRRQGAIALERSKRAIAHCETLLTPMRASDPFRDVVIASRIHAERMMLGAYRLCPGDSFALSLCQDAMRRYSKEPGARSRAERLWLQLTLGSISAAVGDSVGALNTFEAVANALQSGDEPVFKAYVDLQRASALARLGRFEEADRRLSSANTILASHNDSWFHVTGLRKRGEVDLAKLKAKRLDPSQQEGAEGNLYECNERLQHWRDEREMKKLYATMAEWFRVRGQSDSAATYRARANALVPECSTVQLTRRDQVRSELLFD